MNSFYYKGIYLLITAFLLTGIVSCEKNRQKSEGQTKADHGQEALTNANKKIEELSIELNQLRAENQRLKTENDRLASGVTNITARAQQLIACYGTGIWDYGDNPEFPVFVKAMQGSDVKEIIVELNERFRKYKQPTISLKKQAGHTVYIGVDNEEQLGEEMGSNGALSYMTMATFSLASVKGIDCVYFDIGESDHASPGKYCKDSLDPFMPK
jgi:hypothetical protein